MRTFFIGTLISILTSGCANIHTEQHFETDQGKIEAAKTLSEADSSVSTLYIFRESAWLQSIAYTPLPPEYISVNGTMAAIMPMGSYLALTLVPGRAEVSRLIVYGTKVVEEKLEIHSQPGKKIFAGSRFFGFTTPFVQVDAKTGERIIENAQLAKIIYKPVSKAEFIHRVGAVDEGKSRPLSSSPIQNFLPTEQQVTATLEVLASIAMFVVLVAGVAIAAKGIALPVESPPPQNIISPPIYTQPASFQKTTSLQLNSGSLAELIQSEAETEIRDYSSGTRYRVGGGKVIGSDGSRFQVVGSTIIGDRGYTLQVVGNNVFTSDGRRCSKISSLLTCK